MGLIKKTFKKQGYDLPMSTAFWKSVIWLCIIGAILLVGIDPLDIKEDTLLDSPMYFNSDSEIFKDIQIGYKAFDEMEYGVTSLGDFLKMHEHKMDNTFYENDSDIERYEKEIEEKYKSNDLFMEGIFQVESVRRLNYNYELSVRLPFFNHYYEISFRVPFEDGEELIKALEKGDKVYIKGNFHEFAKVKRPTRTARINQVVFKVEEMEVE